MADLRIVDAPLLSTVKGTEKLPTGGEGNFSVSVNQVADFAKLKWVLATEGYVDNAVGNVQADLNLHKNNEANPHNVTKVQVGLGNVDNTADLDKPLSNADVAALSLKADKSYVDTQNNLKADKNTVETSLLLKADKTDLIASKITSDGGQTQQEINDFGGAEWWNKPSGYKLGATVKLANGDIVKSTIANNTTNPNIDMMGWVKTNNASQISDKSGLTQQKINDLTVTPYHFGGIGDGLNHPLSERYTTLAQAQSVYPFAEALTDSLDYCALRTFFDFCQLNVVNNANVSFNAYVHKKLYLTGPFKTKTYYGDLSLTNTQTVYEIDALIQINVVDFKLFGKLNTTGTVGAVKDRKQLGGVIFGDGGTDGSGGRIYIDTINCVGFRSFGLLLINDSIFPSFGYNYNARIGSRGAFGGAADTVHEATFSARVDSSPSNYEQYTELTVSSLPADSLDKFQFSMPVMLQHAGEIYRVISIDAATNKIRVYPCLNFIETDNSISYIYGTGCGWTGNNSGCGNFGVIQSILCGIGFWSNSLYGATIGYAISEACGVGVTLAVRSTNVISYTIGNSYFESNQFNYVNQWDNLSHRNLVRFLGAHALDLSKSADLFNYRVSVQDVATGGRRSPGRFTSCSFYLDGEDYHVNKFTSYKSDLTSSADFVLISTAAANQALSINMDKVTRFDIDRKLLIVAPHSQELTLTPPDGWTFSSSVVLNANDDNVLIYMNIDATTKVLTPVYAKSKTASTSYDPPSIAANSSVSTTVTLSGAQVGGIAQAAFSRYHAELEISAVVSATNTVTVKFKNTGEAAINPAIGTLTVKLI